MWDKIAYLSVYKTYREAKCSFGPTSMLKKNYKKQKISNFSMTCLRKSSGKGSLYHRKYEIYSTASTLK